MHGQKMNQNMKLAQYQEMKEAASQLDESTIQQR